MREIGQRISMCLYLYSWYLSQMTPPIPVNLSESNISNEISFVLQGDESLTSINSQNRIKLKLLDHIYSGTDVILITSSQQKTGSLFLQQCFSDNHDQIRTIFLNSDSFPKEDFESNNPAHDLSMISAVVYESIHLDTHFAIILDDADQLPLQILNELIKLALAINTSKNNVNFIFAGGPSLLGVVQQVSDITRLSLAHCSLDEITQEDIEVYIDEKQSECVESKKLKFNKYALKRIATHANGSLLKASTLLEWCREYAIHTGNFKVTVGFIDEILKNTECSHLLSNYPAADFSFTDSVTSQSKDENIEFTKQEEVLLEQPLIEEESKTIYIDETNTNNNNEDVLQNVYEKVMAATPSDIVSIDGSDVKNISIEEDNSTKTISLEDSKQDSNHEETEYQDSYHIEALKDINTPLSPTYAEDDISPAEAPAQLTSTSSNANNSVFLWTFLILSLLVGGYYLISSNIISYNDIRAYIGTVTSKNDNEDATSIDHNIIATVTPSISTDNKKEKTNQKISSLLELAELQIKQKKLSTPPSDNALDTYKLILESDPNNKEALAGIKLIKDRYQTWAKLDIKDGNSKRAIYFLQRAIDISPDGEALNLLSGLQ